MEKVKGKNKAAEGKVEKETATAIEEKVPLSEEQYKQLRADAKQKCGIELRELLAKYGCDLKAQITCTELGNSSQVFIVDAKKNDKV